MANTTSQFSDVIHAQIDPAYELLEDGRVRHRTTGILRPKMYSELPIPFKQWDRIKVVDGSSQFPLGTIYIIHKIYQDVIYVHEIGSTKVQAACWERFDLA